MPGGVLVSPRQRTPAWKGNQLFCWLIGVVVQAAPIRPVATLLGRGSIDAVGPRGDIPGWQYANCIREAASWVDIIIVGGGDGTLSSCAKAVASGIVRAKRLKSRYYLRANLRCLGNSTRLAGKDTKRVHESTHVSR